MIHREYAIIDDMDNLHEILTNAELYDQEWLKQTRLCEAALEAESKVNSSLVTTNPLLIPSLLTRARLSGVTRVAEERRLASLERKRLSLRERKPRDKRYRPYTAKQKTVRKKNRYEFEKQGGFGAILRARGYKKIDKELWDKYITPLFQEYSPEYLTIKLYKRVPAAVAGRSGYYYGTKDWPLTVYTLRVEHKLLGTLYEGREQEELDNKKAAQEAA